MPSTASWEHVGFGCMNGPDGKPFCKTRAGGVLKLRGLIEMTSEKGAGAAAARGGGSATT